MRLIKDLFVRTKALPGQEEKEREREREREGGENISALVRGRIERGIDQKRFTETTPNKK